ncbi:DMT family transporter [Legionella tunisiensis]|uniref:DMT family transporter n=1 Tax=Legionella tunisiensis TaxID=1034944 RepID=UPI00036FE4A6|nr:SMR family transporter [Legionella tunisiensis]
MSWFILIIAGLFEVCWAILLKYTNGFTHIWSSIGTLIMLLISILFLAVAMKDLPVGTAYTVWTGIGALGTVILGIVFFGDSASIGKLFCLGLIFPG